MVNTGQTRASQAYDAAKRAHQVEKEAAVLSAQREAERIESEFSRERLGVLAFAGGYEKDVHDLSVASKELAALEELAEDE